MSLTVSLPAMFLLGLAPLGGSVGESLVNVLEVNLGLRARYGAAAR